jgi:YHYH protein
MNSTKKFIGFVMLGLITCAIISCNTTITDPTTTGTAGVQCDYSYSALNSSTSVKLTSTSSWSCSSTTRTLAGNGVPDHEVGTFPNDNNPNTISAQTASATYTLSPVATSTATTLGGPAGALGYAVNSVKFDPDTGGSCNDAGTSCSLIGGTGNWRMEALGQTSFNFGVDSSNAHVQPTGEYHYHGLPEGFVTKLNKGTAMSLIGWAADGFPIYARYGYTTATDATSAIKVMTGSYRTKATPDTNRPATTLYAMGTFKQDWEYVSGLGDLDECNGRTGVTPEFPKGIYHYYATDTYPFVQRCVKGKVTVTQGPPPGGAPPK